MKQYSVKQYSMKQYIYVYTHGRHRRHEHERSVHTTRINHAASILRHLLSSCLQALASCTHAMHITHGDHKQNHRVTKAATHPQQQPSTARPDHPLAQPFPPGHSTKPLLSVPTVCDAPMVRAPANDVAGGAQVS